MRHCIVSPGFRRASARVALAGVLALVLSSTARADLVTIDFWGMIPVSIWGGNTAPIGGVDFANMNAAYAGYWQIDPDIGERVPDPNYGTFDFDDPRNRIHLDLSHGGLADDVVSLDFRLTRITYSWSPPTPTYGGNQTYSFLGTLVGSNVDDITGGGVWLEFTSFFFSTPESPFDALPLPPDSSLRTTFTSAGGGSAGLIALERPGGTSLLRMWPSFDPTTRELYRIRPPAPAAVPEPAAAIAFGCAFLLVSHALKPWRRH